MLNTNLIILTEVGGDVGYGHLTRCQAIQRAFGGNSVLIAHSFSHLHHVKNLTVIQWHSQPENFLKLIKKFSGFILVDSYIVNDFFLKKLRGYPCRLAVIDDYNRINYDVDLIINPAIYGPDFFNQQARVVGGADYVILRPEFLGQPAKKQRNSVSRLLITLGGGSRAELFDKVMGPFSSLNVEKFILAGSTEQEIFLKSHKDSYEFSIISRIDNVLELSDLYKSMDLVISAGGQTLNELSYLGVPFIPIEVGVDQHWNIAGFVKAKITPYHFFANQDNLGAQLLGAVKSLGDLFVRDAMGSLGRLYIDGNGANRIANLFRL